MRKLSTLRRAMPRMEWGPRNLYILWQRSISSRKEEGVFTRTRLSLFQQRWKSKALVRAYHGDHIPEKIFRRWYLPGLLPDVRPKRPVSEDKEVLSRFAMRETKRKEEEQEKGMAPVGSLMFSEVERRIDVFIFRCCFAHSVYEARRLVIHGHVLLNGKKHENANTRLAPGDMVSVDPKEIRFLQESPTPDAESAADTKQHDAESRPETLGPEEGDQLLSTSISDGEESATSNESSKWREVSRPAEISARSPPVSNGGSLLTPFNLPPYASPFIFIPAYIEPSFATCSAIYVRHPTARPGYSEIPTPFDADGEVVRLAWEWYQKRRPRIRSKRQLARMPENRQTPVRDVY